MRNLQQIEYAAIIPFSETLSFKERQMFPKESYRKSIAAVGSGVLA